MCTAKITILLISTYPVNDMINRWPLPRARADPRCWYQGLCLQGSLVRWSYLALQHKTTVVFENSAIRYTDSYNLLIYSLIYLFPSSNWIWFSSRNASCTIVWSKYLLNAIVHVILKTKSTLNKCIFFQLLSCITHSMIYMYSNITNSKWVWSGNTTITNWRQTRGTARKSHTAITRHQEDKLSKATSSLFPIKMIARLEMEKSNAQQNIKQYQSLIMGLTRPQGDL